jgi:hypothetical protein
MTAMPMVPAIIAPVPGLMPARAAKITMVVTALLATESAAMGVVMAVFAGTIVIVSVASWYLVATAVLAVEQRQDRFQETINLPRTVIAAILVVRSRPLVPLAPVLGQGRHGNGDQDQGGQGGEHFRFHNLHGVFPCLGCSVMAVFWQRRAEPNLRARFILSSS